MVDGNTNILMKLMFLYVHPVLIDGHIERIRILIIHQRNTVAGFRVPFLCGYHAAHLRGHQSCQRHCSHMFQGTTSRMQEPELLCRFNQVSVLCFFSFSASVVSHSSCTVAMATTPTWILTFTFLLKNNQRCASKLANVR